MILFNIIKKLRISAYIRRPCRRVVRQIQFEDVSISIPMACQPDVNLYQPICSQTLWTYGEMDRGPNMILLSISIHICSTPSASACNLQFFNVLKFSLSFNEDGQNMTLIQYLFADQILTDWVPGSPFPVFLWKWGSGEEEKRTLLYYYWARRLSVFPIMSVVL